MDDLELYAKNEEFTYCVLQLITFLVKLMYTYINEVRNATYTTESNECSYREKTKCSIMNLCLSTNLLYKCTIHTRGGPNVNIGATADSFKNRYRNHISSFKNINRRYSTSLTDFVWQCKEGK